MRRNFFSVVAVIAVLAVVAIATNPPIDQETFDAFTKGFELAMKRPNIRTNETFGAIADPNAGAPACSFNGIDFSELTSTTDYIGKDPVNPGNSYWMNMCAISNKGGDCADKNGMICQANAEGKQFTLATWTDAGHSPEWSITADNEVALFLRNGPADCFKFPESVARNTTVFFYCGNPDNFVVSEYPDALCVYTMKFPTPILCPGHGGKKGGMSGGTIFLIIVIVVTFVYIVGGCIWNWKRNEKRGMEACPHRTFWCAIPGYTKDGCMFTWGKIRGLCSGTKTTSSGQYNDV